MVQWQLNLRVIRRVPRDDSALLNALHRSVLSRLQEVPKRVTGLLRLLAERPELDGISVIGMPTNSPGMGEPNGKPLDILAFHKGRVTDYMSVTTY